MVEYAYQSGDSSDEQLREQLAGFVAKKRSEDKPERPGGGSEKRHKKPKKSKKPKSDLSRLSERVDVEAERLRKEKASDPETSAKIEDYLKRIEEIDPGLSQEERGVAGRKILDEAVDTGILKKVNNGKLYSSILEIPEGEKLHYAFGRKYRGEEATTKKEVSKHSEAEEAEISVVQKLQNELSDLENRIRDIQKPDVVARAMQDGDEKHRILLLETYKKTKEELLKKIELNKKPYIDITNPSENAIRMKEEIAAQKEDIERITEELEKEEAQPTEPLVEKKEELPDIDKEVEELINKSGMGIALHERIHQLSEIPQPVKRGVLDRLYLQVFKNEQYKEYEKNWQDYNKTKAELQRVKEAEFAWKKQEQKLAKEYYEKKSRIEELVQLEQDGTINKKQWKELKKITGKLELMRENINKIHLEPLRETTGYKGELPGVWKPLEKNTDNDALAKEIKRELNEGKISEQFSELSPELQKRFFQEQTTDSLRNLGELRVERRKVQEKISECLKKNDPSALFKLTSILREIDFQERVAEKAVEDQIKSFKFAGKMEEFGKEGKKILKEMFNFAFANVGDDFEIKYDTALKDIILNGQGKFSKMIVDYWKVNNAFETIINRTLKHNSKFLLFHHKQMEKYIPSRDKSESEIRKHQLIIEGLDKRDEELRNIIKEITEVRGKIKIDSEWTKTMNDAEKENVRRDIVLETINKVSPTKTRKEGLIEQFNKTGFTEELKRELGYLCQMEIARGRREREKLEKQLEDERKNRDLLDRQIEKSEDRLAGEYADIDESEWAEREKEFEQQILLAKEREESIKKAAEEQIKKLRELSEKSLARRLKEKLTSV